MTGSLRGIKVLDLTRVLAGPYCTMILGDLGAEVLKIEAPGGSDETREWGPPFKEGVSAYYLCTNRNKKSLTVNLKTEEGKSIIEDLVKESDIVINNFKTGTMDRLGLGYESLSNINPGIVYCSITGFGETGPYKDRPGYDFIIQAMSGLMSITGEEDSSPQKLGVAITDILTGLYACIGIQAALLEREASGRGQKIDISLYDSAISSLVNIASNYLVSGKIPNRLGNKHANIVPYQTFAASDAEMVIAVGNDRQFASFCEMLSLRELPADERFATNAQRVKNQEHLLPLLQEQLVKQPLHYWQKRCEEQGIPFGPIQNIEEMTEDSHVLARNMIVTMPHPTAGDIRLIGSPLKLSRTPVVMDRHPPLPGEHTIDILKSQGLTEAQIDLYKENNII
ncbi:crotonobetainyl-CoA:carnitine CoA-transferase CaiB-like acyl-CoA transferase [Bacillus ectoiniformans]|uniref:CaiB/BaiF CoA transferase family protein n=1 Tax=Bacillus ectoiniformans TaxID=1494429 RepID=UPI00195C5C14|nr:CaiB/BaiF CoA-transferase family protein [Bacillus ectoiniformans]MBM7648100.1 crotonobetainyl-CoA:carnitine CoA-transferase CaiB-like acyl-CoA transferase [Bacillus ectoiniformans]